VRVVTVAGEDVAWSELDWPTLLPVEEEVLPDEDLLVVDVLFDAFADSAGSSPCAIWTASPPVRASAAAAAIAVIFAVSLIDEGRCRFMARTVSRPPQRNLGSR
jgi:hypothetical protein